MFEEQQGADVAGVQTVGGGLGNRGKRQLVQPDRGPLVRQFVWNRIMIATKLLNIYKLIAP